jgi:hypothetical protein
VRRLLFLFALAFTGCSSSPGVANRADATAAFEKEVEPEVTSLISGAIFDPAETPTWRGPASLAVQGDMSKEDLFKKGDRVQRGGTLSAGATFLAEGFYSYTESRMESVTLIIDFPSQGTKKPDAEVPITEALLKSLHIHPALIEELVKGIGQGSMNGSNRKDQSVATISGKRFEASTALVRDKPLLLELSCTYSR